MKRMGTRALAMTGVVAVVLMVGSSAQAGWWRDRLRDIRESLSEREWDGQQTHQHSFWCGHLSPSGGPEPGPAVPEPSAALVFGAGLLVARGFARRNR